ncbi:hypothetical protein [Mycolicibacterium phocaicum]|jgi:hypothetical protein|uniref:Uncharacterized protein n=1 Tax=Mycolicibacterium phocaicum TaxID=319706 RepID=A0A7I7ZNE4_9MYCO|nr:hypothetical protein [Mycolicibacterium phocaicum]TLH71517.1 hypothetical protein C1S79_07515 [Mycolicibacterium phocaicum]UCZ62193.1 hypothetical protein LHJ73_08400 [Mycolicibacterium phocaicum]BBZ54927.1 hypothetical protein MPHO_19190 [Mycolicibacterium phocaicum]SHV87404.1 Uncharacterised protein [Mycobacteroides abscessus subsp. abscessus]
MIAHTRLAGGVVAVSAAVIMTITGCGKDSAPPAASKSATSSSAATSTTASAPAQPVDYSALLIKATDLVAPEEFIASPPVPDPDGKPGIATSFGNADRTHVVGDTILILPDPAAATAALEAAKAALGGSVVGGTPAPIEVGSGGISVSGNSPDNTKSVTVVLFTEGRAFVTLEFDGPKDATPPPDFVLDVGQKQALAIKNGLHG